jgi:hypothetical protein
LPAAFQLNKENFRGISKSWSEAALERSNVQQLGRGQQREASLEIFEDKEDSEQCRSESVRTLYCSII